MLTVQLDLKLGFWVIVKRIEVPVLPSMVLVNINDKDINKVFDCSSVIRYMFWLGKRAVVRQSEVEILKKYLKRRLQFHQ